MSIAKRFWTKVERTDGCWYWRAALSSTGYGVFAPRRSGLSAARVAWELTYGPVPLGLEVDHRCNNSRCVRPEHLQLLTRRQNARKNRKANVRMIWSWNRAALVDILHMTKQVIGREPTIGEIAMSPPYRKTFDVHFGSIREAFHVAGFRALPVGRPKQLHSYRGVV